MSDQHKANRDESLPIRGEEKGFAETNEIGSTARDDQSIPATEALGCPESLSLEDSFDTSLLAAPSNPSSLGRLGKYEILRVIGHGGMGVVLKGFDESLHRLVAIKVLSRQLATSPTARRRFIREARAAAAINHPNVVTIHAVEDHEGQPYIVMEFVDGPSLLDRIREQAPLELGDVLRLGAQIASGLAAAHEQGVIHRDIKPGNVMLESNVDRVKITDFGLARVAMDNADLTSQGHRLGTPAYMSPEQVSGTEVDERTDLFSFGCVLYAMISGHSPFRGKHAFDAARKIIEDSPVSLDQISEDVPPFLAEIVDRLLAKKPSARFDSATEVAELLHHYTTRLNQTRTDELGTVLRGERLRTSKMRVWIALIPAVAMVVVGLSILFVWRPWVQRDGKDDRAESVAGERPGKTADLPLLSGTLRVAKSGQSQFSSIQEALERAGPGATIEVIDDSTYHGAIAFNDAERWRDVTLAASNGAKLSAPFKTPVIQIESTPGVTIRGFQIEAFHGQHGIEITGLCPGVVVESITARRVPNVNSPAQINFAYLHDGAAGTEQAPIILRKLNLHGEGHGIAIGELTPKPADIENPVRWLRVEECTLANADDRSGYCLFLLNYVDDILVTRNTFADAEIGISVLMRDANQGHRIEISQNTFHNLGSLITFDANLEQDKLVLSSNLISRTERVTPGQRPATALPIAWFSANAWIEQTSSTDPSISSIATIINGVTFQSENSADENYLRPTANSFDSLGTEGSPFPGRYASQ